VKVVGEKGKERIFHVLEESSYIRLYESHTVDPDTTKTEIFKEQ